MVCLSAFNENGLVAISDEPAASIYEDPLEAFVHRQRCLGKWDNIRQTDISPDFCYTTEVSESHRVEEFD
jgi:hypothetical protein